MARLPLQARSAFLESHPIARETISADFREDFALVGVAARKGARDELIAAIQNAYSVALPDGPGRASGPRVAFVWSGPDQWLAVGDGGDARNLAAELAHIVGESASLVEQSSGRVIVRVSGPRARDALAKGVPIDLHPRAFATDSAAVTHAHHIGILIWQVDETPTYDIALFRSYADSFMRWLAHSVAEFE